MTVTQVLGAKVQPTFADPTEWNSTRTYAPLTIVLHEGNSYTSRQYVPVGIDITNTDFWAETGNYNAQVEQYRKEVSQFDSRITDINKIASNALTLANTLQGYASFNVRDYGAVGDGITNDYDAFIAAFKAASDSVKSNYHVFSAEGLHQWQANIFIPSGTYLIKGNIEIPTANSLTTSDDNRVCGINIIGQAMPTIDFDGKYGFIIDGSFFSCRNLMVQNASTTFRFAGSKFTPYIEFEDVFIRASTNGIVAETGFYMSRFTHVIGVFISDTFLSCGPGGNTSVVVTNCYCTGGCKVCYDMGNQSYSAMIGCACDGADIAYRFGTETVVSNYSNTILIGCGAEGTGTHYLYFRNIANSAFKIIGFNFNYPQSTVDHLVHNSACNNITLDFENTLYSAISRNVNFINTTGNIIVNSDITNDNVTLPAGAPVKQTSTFYKYLATLETGTATPFVKIRTSANYGFAKLHVQGIHSTDTLQFFDYDIDIVINVADSQAFINASGYESIASIKPTFTYDIATNLLSLSFETAKSDMRLYVSSDVYSHSLVGLI